MYRLDHTDVVSLFCSATLRAVVAYGVCWATRSVWHALRALACLCSAHVLRMLSLLGAVRGRSLSSRACRMSALHALCMIELLPRSTMSAEHAGCGSVLDERASDADYTRLHGTSSTRKLL